MGGGNLGGGGGGGGSSASSSSSAARGLGGGTGGDSSCPYSSSEYALPSVLFPPLSLSSQRRSGVSSSASSFSGREKRRPRCLFPGHYDVGNLVRRQPSSSSFVHSSYRPSASRAGHQQNPFPFSLLLVPPPPSAPLSSSSLSPPSSLLSSLRSAFAAGTSPPSAHASSSLPSPLVYIHPVTGTVHPYPQKPTPPPPTHLVLSLPPSSLPSDSSSSRSQKDVGRDTRKEKTSASPPPPHQGGAERGGGGGGSSEDLQQVQSFIRQQLRRTRSIHTLVIQFDGAWLARLSSVLQGHPTVTNVYLEYIHNLPERELICKLPPHIEEVVPST